MRQGFSLLPFQVNLVLEILASAIKEKKEGWLKGWKVTSHPHDCSCTNPKPSTDKLLEYMIKVTEYYSQYKNCIFM